MSELAASLWNRYGYLKNERHTWDDHWQEIADRILPRHAEFQNEWTKGAKRNQKVFDNTGQLALMRFTAALDSMITPQGQRYQHLKASDPDIDKLVNVRRYFDKVGELLFRYRYSSKAAFATNLHEVYASLGAFGTGGILTEPRAGGGMWYKCLPLSTMHIAENNEGRIDTVFREFRFTAKQAYEQWGDNCPSDILEVLGSSPDRQFKFLHVIQPNPDYDPDRFDAMGMPYASYYLADCDKENILQRGGYGSLPIAVSRYVTAPTEKYGRSPAMMVLPELKQLNEMEKTTIRAAHLAVQPPLLLHDDLSGVGFQMKPNALNPGTLSGDGKQLAQPFNSGTRPDIGLDMMEQKRKVVNDAFLITLFQILVETHTMSATEVIERAREKGALLAPTLARQTSELLNPITERELDILERQGLLPEMPGELLEAEGEYEIQYDSPLSRAQESEKAQAYARTMESITPIAQINPDALAAFDFEEMARGLADVHGMPANWIKPREQVAAEKQQAAQMEQLQMLLQSGEMLAGTEEKAARAQEITARV